MLMRGGQARIWLRTAVSRPHNTFSQQEIPKQAGNKKILPEQPLKQLCIHKFQMLKARVRGHWIPAKSAQLVNVTPKGQII